MATFKLRCRRTACGCHYCDAAHCQLSPANRQPHAGRRRLQGPFRRRPQVRPLQSRISRGAHLHPLARGLQQTRFPVTWLWLQVDSHIASFQAGPSAEDNAEAACAPAELLALANIPPAAKGQFPFQRARSAKKCNLYLPDLRACCHLGTAALQGQRRTPGSPMPAPSA